MRHRLFTSAKREKRIGASDKRDYDIPLNQDSSAGFMILLIALMSFLATVALASSFALNTMTQKWSSGLENRATIEIPAQNDNKTIRSTNEMRKLLSAAHTLAEQSANVIDVDILDQKDVAGLVEPWLGEDIPFDDLPLPGLISVTFAQEDPNALGNLQKQLEKLDKTIRLDTHEAWLADLLRLTRTLKFSSLFLLVVIGLTTLTAIAGAVRSKMAIHQEDIELLHLMGASDLYIGRQFQRHALIMALKGALAGLLCGVLILLIIGWIAGQSANGFIPDFNLSLLDAIALLSLPFFVCIFAALTARMTVLRALAEIP